MVDLFQVYGVEEPVTNTFSILPGIVDFLRVVSLAKGKVLFVESQENWS